MVDLPAFRDQVSKADDLHEPSHHSQMVEESEGENDLYRMAESMCDSKVIQPEKIGNCLIAKDHHAAIVAVYELEAP